jgi:hypothetical protein
MPRVLTPNRTGGLKDSSRNISGVNGNDPAGLRPRALNLGGSEGIVRQRMDCP